MALASSTLSAPQNTPGAARSDEELAPGDIAVGVIIGRASESFDFFVFGIASVLCAVAPTAGMLIPFRALQGPGWR